MHLYGKTRRFSGLLLAVITLGTSAMLFGCGGSNDSGSASSVASNSNTTVLVYMNGSDLESKYAAASDNIKEMMAVGSTANMNVVIQTGGADKLPAVNAAVGSPESINWKNIQRYSVRQGSIALVPGGDLGPDNVSDASHNMGNQQTLNDFVQWGVTNYPATKYIVVMWSHGAGVNFGIGPDEITKNSIPTAQIGNVFQQVSVAKGVQFEIIGFDACLMATSEVAASLIAPAKYMVSSEDVEPGGSWAYTDFLNYITRNPSANGLQVGTVIVDSYVKKMTTTQIENNSTEQTVTLSVVDLSKIQTVIDATNAFAQALNGITLDASIWKQIAQARLHSLDWMSSALFGQFYDLVDMMIFTQNVVNGVKVGGADYPAVTSSGNALANAIQAAVVYKNATNLSSDSIATGLTVYFPSILSQFNDAYAANTTTYGASSSYFASHYSGLNGFVASYVKFYQNSLLPGSAIPPLTATVSDPQATTPYAATVSNDFDFVLAAYQSGGCKIYDDKNVQVTTTKCYDAISDGVTLNQATAPNWNVSLTAANKWIYIEGVNYSVSMVPDQTAPKTGNSAAYGRYLISAYRPVVDPNTKVITYSPGFLLVEESYPIPSGSTTPFTITGFQAFSPLTGGLEKVLPIESGGKYFLGAYYCSTVSASSCSFGRTDKVVLADASTQNLKLKYGSVATSGGFGYIVNDLTGSISLSDQVVY